jgi:micrococcal nuclease
VQCFGKVASNKMHELVEGKVVRLEKDVTGDTTDKYGRSLRHAYVGTLDVNAYMIKEGYAYAYTFFPFSFLSDYKEYQRQAELAKLGLWNPQNCPTDVTRSLL